MVDEFIELMNLGVIKFPYEFKQEFIAMAKKADDDTEIIENYQLSDEEIVALANLDLMKNEITSIYKYENAEKTTKSYALAKDKESKMHDDRFYTVIMLAHYLYDLRRGQTVTTEKPRADYSSAPMFSSTIEF